jgi:hypothetical protein
MGQEIGVDVERIQQLVAALENLRDVLADNVPVIVNVLNRYWSGGIGQPISLLVLQQAPPRSVDDAAAILARARMALAFRDQPDAGLPGGMVAIPWNMSRQDQAEYEEGVRAAKNLEDADQLTKADFENVIALLAREGGNPYYTAGFFNGLNAQYLNHLINLLGILGTREDTARIYHALVTAMANGSLSSASRTELADLLSSTGTQAFIAAQQGGIYFLGETVPVGEFYAERYELLEDIAKNPEASANLIASTDPAQIQVILESFDPNFAPFCRNSAGIRSILQIMTNAVRAEPPPGTLTQTPSASKLVASLSSDLEVLNAETLSQNSRELAAFMRAAVSQLTPPVPRPLAQPQLTEWTVCLRQNLLTAIQPLLQSIALAYQNTQQSISLQRAILAGAVIGALTALIPPVGGTGMAMGMGAAEGAAESTPGFEDLINKGMSYLIPDNLENGAQAVLSATYQLEEIIMISSLSRVYDSAGDISGLHALLNNPDLWGVVSALATGAPLSGPEAQLLYSKPYVPVYGDSEYTLGQLFGLAGIASPKLTHKDLQ